MICLNPHCENHQKDLGITKFCPECGQKTVSSDPQSMTCHVPGCANQGNDLGKMRFCPECGATTVAWGGAAPKSPQSGSAQSLAGGTAPLPQVQLPAGYAGYQSGTPGSSRSIIAGDQNINHSTVVHNQDQTKQVRQCAVSGRQAEVTKGHVCPSCGLWVHEDYFDEALMRCDRCGTALGQRAARQFEAKVQEFLGDGVITREKLSELKSLGGRLGMSQPEQDTIINRLKQDVQRRAAAQRPMSLIDQTRWKAVLRAVDNKVFRTDPVAGRGQLDALRMLHKSYPDNDLIATLLVSILAGEVVEAPRQFLPEIEQVLNSPCFEHDSPQKYLTQAMFFRGAVLRGLAQVSHSEGAGNWSDMLEQFSDRLRTATSAMETMFPDSSECNALQVATMIDSYQLSTSDEHLRGEINLLLEGAAGAAGESDIGIALKAAYSNATEGLEWDEKREMSMGQGLARMYFEELFLLNLINCHQSERSQSGRSGKLLVTAEANQFERLRKAAWRGNVESIYNLGISYAEGEGVTQSYEEAVKWFRKAADQGDEMAQNRLGSCYYRGEGVTQSYEEAVKWYRKAADQGWADAQFLLGSCYAEGEGVTQSYEEAVKWYRKAADQGDAVAQDRLGISYHLGEGVTQSHEEAVKWWRKAADQDFAKAQNKIGASYAEGNGVTQNHEEVVKWFRKAADQGYTEAQNNLGDCYYWGDGVTKSYEEAVKWYRKAADQGDEYAQFLLGSCYAEGEGVTQNHEEAVKWFRKAADQGDANAQYRLGRSYLLGEGVTQSYEETVQWYRKAADQGYECAQTRLGICYAEGNGVTQDYEEAVKWFRKAADQGDANAQNCLGDCYAGGEGVTQSHEEAVKWFRKAADQGDEYAQNCLGNCYYVGKGVTQDYEEAVKWFRKAADQGDAMAQYRLGSCYEFGNGVTKSNEEAVKWIRKAADQGCSEAYIHLKYGNTLD